MHKKFKNTIRRGMNYVHAHQDFTLLLHWVTGRLNSKINIRSRRYSDNQCVESDNQND